MFILPLSLLSLAAIISASVTTPTCAEKNGICTISTRCVNPFPDVACITSVGKKGVCCPSNSHESAGLLPSNSSHRDPLLSNLSFRSLRDPPRAPLCAENGGICTVASRCENPFLNSTMSQECRFSDGPGVCCPSPGIGSGGSRLSCTNAGGICAPIAGCFMVGGELAAGRCVPKSTGVTCCVSGNRCPHARNYKCCDSQVSFRPICDWGGELRCPVKGTTLRPNSECP